MGSAKPAANGSAPVGSQRYNFPRDPVANPKAVVQGPNYRFTLLTPRVLRYEYAADGIFEDRASTFALNRNLPVPEFEVQDSETGLEIRTEGLDLFFDKSEEGFTTSGLQIQVLAQLDHEGKWFYGSDESRWNLKGTYRTLDEANGRIPLELGLMSLEGFATINDSETMLFEEDGWVGARRPGKRVDGYLFGHGRDYRAALHDYFLISGKPPLLPRWALGNWWSRYYKYSADSYLKLMDKFQEEKIPLTVAVIDMDWHRVEDVPERWGNGWTGYSWNKQLFPDPPKFLDTLHKRGLKSTLNLHPAHGVRPFEDAYEDMCKAIGKDPKKEETIAFDVTDRKFMDAYFDVLHRGLEDQGVDFWWIDFQQGENARLRGIKNLQCLNHYHFLDSGRDNRRPITFSRFGGPGSQRYPVGFSGDTLVTWQSLDFQPEFTATASNIGYGWWSHDIGGHMFGGKNDELMARWTQLGVFSPIFRLHSNENPFNTKEPWSFDRETQDVMTSYMRMRHRLIPYLYSLNVECARDGRVLVEPLYYKDNFNLSAYRYKNQFYFGEQLLIFPLTAPRDSATKLSQTQGWFPPGRWVDLQNGRVYDGDRELTIHRYLHEYPVFAKEGSIVPLDANEFPANDTSSPESLELLVVVGADARFEIHEDDGTGSNIDEVKLHTTTVTYKQSTGELHVTGSNRRRWVVTFVGLDEQAIKGVKVDGGEVSKTHADARAGQITLEASKADFVVKLAAKPELRVADPRGDIWKILDRAQVYYELKRSIWKAVNDEAPLGVKISRVLTSQGAGEICIWDDLRGQPDHSNIKDAVLECLLADGRSGK